MSTRHRLDPLLNPRSVALVGVSERPGSVGQPRDGLPAGSYLVLDTDAARIEFIRFGYDVAKAAAKIRAAGLPDFFAERLGKGH